MFFVVNYMPVRPRSTNKVDLEFLSQGLHDIGAAGMQQRMQDAIDAVSDEYDAIALGYGLCNNGLMNVEARKLPLVIPLAHDCITPISGSRDNYLREFDKEPGTYFKTSGWIERNDSPEELNQISIQRKSGMDFELRRSGRKNMARTMPTSFSKRL